MLVIATQILIHSTEVDPIYLPAHGPAPLPAAASQVQAYLRAARAANTIRAYRADWRDFAGWCTERGRSALPADPSTVALYLSDLSNRAKVSTLNRRLWALGQAHQLAGYEAPSHSPLIRELMAGIRRVQGSAPAGKAPLLVEDLRRMLAVLPEGLLGIRDRAILLLGFAGAFRRSELVGLDVEDLALEVEGLVVHLRQSKTDPEGQGRKIGIPRGNSAAGTCAVEGVRQWLEKSGIESGALFRVMTRHGKVFDKRLSGEAVALVVKRYVDHLGYDPARFAGHSLRAGFATSAAARGKSERSIMLQTGHRSLTTVRRYIRDGNLFRDNAASGLGL